MPLTLRKINSFRSTMSWRNCGAIHREEALVLTLTEEETGGDARGAFSKSLDDDATKAGGGGTGDNLLYPFKSGGVFVSPLHLGDGSR